MNNNRVIFDTYAFDSLHFSFIHIHWTYVKLEKTFI